MQRTPGLATRVGRSAVVVMAVALLITVSLPGHVLASSPEFAGASERWSMSELPSVSRGPVTVRDVTAGPRGFVAVGETCSKRFSCTAAAWFSRDGKKWKMANVDRLERRAGRAPESSLDSVAWGPGGFVAVGWFRPPMIAELARVPTEGPMPVAAAWRSRDGKRWRRVVSGYPFSSNPTPGQIVASDAGYMVLSPGRSMVVTSPDGLDWTKRRAGISKQGGWIARLAPAADGFAAIGNIATRNEEGGRMCCSSAVWRSRTGKSWTRQIVGGEDSYLGRLAAIDDRVVVVQGPRVANEETVPRGGLTRVIEGDGPVVMGSVPAADGLYTVAVAGGRFLAAGQACGPALWVSDDGVTWTRVPWSGELPGGATRWHEVEIVADDERVVLVGTAEVPYPDKPQRRPRLVDFTLSAPLSALASGEGTSTTTTGDCAMTDEMPTAQLSTLDDTVVTGLPATGCWVTRDAGDEPVADCREAGVPPLEALPVVMAEGDPVRLQLTLSDGSSFAAASVVGHHPRDDITGATQLASTASWGSRQAMDFQTHSGARVLIVSVTFDCGQGSASFLFRLRPNSD